jgi:[ribosomal protein S5]-alanine N-acetyltransferase
MFINDMDFKLRPFKPTDAKSLVKYANNWNVAKFLTDKFPYPYTAKDAKAFILFAIKDKPVHLFAIEVNGETAGGIGIHPQTDIHCKNAELGYWLAEPYWGNGIVTRAVKEMVVFAFNTYDITRVFARPFGTNKASQRVLEKAGFLLEGRFEKTLFKKGEYLDELVYALRKEKWQDKGLMK